MKRNGPTLVVSLACLWVGCNRPAEIQRYQVAHESPQVAVSSDRATASSGPSIDVPQRMLGAIVPVDQQTWFFKAMGPTDQINNIASGFRMLLDSVDFGSPDAPTWTLPEGWTQRPGDQFRYATLVANGVEISVSKLVTPKADDTQQYVLSNVNRWRGQLQMPPIEASELAATTQSLELAGGTAVLVDLAGQAPAGGSPMRGPFQGSSTPPPAARPSAPAVTAPPAADRGMAFEKPENWQEGPPNSFRLASFVVEQNGRRAEVTVIPLGPAAGSVLDNVNRWRGQINMPSISEAELNQSISSLTIDGTEGKYIQISDPAAGVQDAILAVIVPQPHQTLFIKMMGPHELVQEQTASFEQFVHSLRLAKP